MRYPLVEYYRELGIEFALEGDQVRVLAQPGVLTDSLQAEVRSRRGIIFSSLSSLERETHTPLEGTTGPNKTTSPPFDEVRRGDEVSQSISLDTWLSAVKSSASIVSILAVVDQFRALPWTDSERASMSRTYMRKIDSFQQATRIRRSQDDGERVRADID